jgi:beta-keto acid cleavage enzyme
LRPERKRSAHESIYVHITSHNGKVIITCAITGSIHTPSMSPYLPITPNDIVDSAFEAA